MYETKLTDAQARRLAAWSVSEKLGVCRCGGISPDAPSRSYWPITAPLVLRPSDLDEHDGYRSRD